MTATATAKPKPAEVAAAFMAAIAKDGLHVESLKRYSGGVGVSVTVAANFTPGSAAEYVKFDQVGSWALLDLPVSSNGWGTIHGSMSDGVGGHASMTSGYFYRVRHDILVRVGKAISEASGVPITNR